MSDELDWGPARPPAVSWAGAFLLLLGLGQLGALGAAVVLDRDALIGAEADRLVTFAVAGLFALQLLLGVGVLRLWRGTFSLGLVVALLGLGLQGIGLAPPPDPLAVVALNAALSAGYLIVIVLLVRGRAAFR